jgi:SAM-dependent methyltransferase
VTSEPPAEISSKPADQTTATIFRRPPGQAALPGFDHGWRMPDGPAQAFLSYVAADPSVNWSDDLEQLHEEASRTHFLDRWTRSAIIGRIAGPAPATIADIGCSTGFLLEDVRAAYPSATLVGADLIAGGLEKAHRLVPSARLLRADACDLPIADASIDAIVSANLLEHVPDDRAALREFARVLSPGGRAVIVVPAGPRTYDYYDRFLGHERRYARHELASKCSDAGLEILADSYIGSLLYPAFWLVKQRNRLTRGRLRGAALQQRVAADIARTHDSRVGELAWQLERRLTSRGINLPFGIRSLVAARRRPPSS